MRTATRRRQGAVSLIAAAAAAAILFTPTAVAAQPDWSGPLYPLAGGAIDFTEAVPGTRATYSNGSTQVGFSANATQLQAGHGYTLWLMVFNHPENCAGTGASNGMRCDMNDHMNPAAGFSLMYGTGDWASGRSLRLDGTRAANSRLNVPEDVLIGPGIINPEGAEIHLRVRDHGPAQDCCAEDQITTINGGCTLDTAMPVVGHGALGDYACADIQGTGS